MKLLNRAKSAFSLIELSIVLIIIGLLIAGVTGGASLIKSSELRSVITESRAWSVAVNSFYNQFDDLPGDYSGTLGSIAGGDADGTIEYDSGADSDTGDHEGRNAWRHLSITNILDTSVIYPIASNLTLASAGDPGANALSTFGEYVPASKIGSAGWDFDYNTTSTHNVVVLTGAISVITSTYDLVNSTTNNLSSGAITPIDGLSLDSKYDDGLANAGSIRATGPNASNVCSNGATYTTTTTTKACAMSFRVDVNT